MTAVLPLLPPYALGVARRLLRRRPSREPKAERSSASRELEGLWEAACDLVEVSPTPANRLAEERLWWSLLLSEVAG